MCRLTCENDSMDVINLCSDSEQEDEVIEIPSEDETSANEDDQFLKDLELAKRLSLDQFTKDQDTAQPSHSGTTSFTITPTVKEKFRNNFRKIKFDWKSINCDEEPLSDGENAADLEEDCSELSCEEEISCNVVKREEGSSPESSSKYVKLEDGSRKPSSERPPSSRYEEQFSDDLPDLEDCFIVEHWNHDRPEEKGDNSREQRIKSEVFSQKAKTNLANILKRVRSFTGGNGSLTSGDTLPSASEQDDEDDGKERHFMDFVGSSLPSPPKPVSKEKVESEYEPQPSTSKEVPIIDWRIKPISLNSNEISSRRRPRKCRIMKSKDEEEEIKMSDIRRYLSPVKKCDSLEKQRIVEFLKPMRCDFSENSLDALTAELENLHINTIQACFDEEHPDFLQRGLQFVEDFLYNYKPCSSIVKHVLEHGLLKSRDLPLMVKSYSILMRISQRYPDLINVDWDMLKGVLDELCIGRGLFQQDPIILWLGSHFLNLFLVTLEADLYHRDLTKQLRQSTAYKMLSYDCAYLNIRELVNWTICTITCGEYSELLDERYIQRKEEQTGTIKREDIRKILPLLQQLLALSINVSTSCKDSAKVVSLELLKSYSYLPSIQHKKLLIDTMKSDLLRYRFVTLVLERYSEDCATMCEFPMDLKIILESLFSALPPRYGLTPPTTPQSEDEEGEQLRHVNTGQYPTAMVEEFVLLLYYAVQSHLHCTRRKVHRSLRTRAYYKKKDIQRLGSDDEGDLQSLPHHVEELRERLLRLTPELSADTQLYLTKLACLSCT